MSFHHGPLPPTAQHVCVDMQRMFAEKTDWHLPWMDRVRPVVHAIAARHPDRTIFTRFIPATHPGDGSGTWRGYWRRWAAMTQERLHPDLISLVPELAALVPPARVVDKHRYGPWIGTTLPALLRARRAGAVIITGGETDVCVIATVLGAVDLGLRVVIVTDALCSVSDQAHDAALRIYRDRYAEQIETVTADELLGAW